jgi:spore germination cell wall hydrolase CwlJ-like protein
MLPGDNNPIVRVLMTLTVFLVVLGYSVANAAEPTAKLTTKANIILQQQLASSKVANSLHNSVTCLAENIYFEARAESYSGKAAVGNVTRNRVESKSFPNTYCAVVQQGPKRESWKTRQTPDKNDAVYYPVKHKCHFSWYCDGQKDVIWANYEKTGQTIEMNAKAWTDSVQLAIMIAGATELQIKDNTSGALYYYNHNLVTPYWVDHFDYIGVLGNHTFMR